MVIKHALQFVLAFVLVASVLGGCGGPSTGEVDPDYLVEAEKLGKQRREIFVKAEGDFDALSVADREAYLDTFDGDEEQGKKFWEFMKNPPRSVGPEIPGQGR